MNRLSRVSIVKGENLLKMVHEGLATLKIKKPDKKIVIKPYLPSLNPYPESTSSELVESLISFFKKFGKGLIIAEGSSETETSKAFKKHGYLKVARKYGILLIDLNKDVRVDKENEKALKFKKLRIPRTLDKSYIISVTIARKTTNSICLSMRNMLSALIREEFYKKELLSEGIVDVNSYLKPRVAVIDLRKAIINDSVIKTDSILLSDDIVAADTVALRVLGLNPQEFRYLKLAEKVGLGITNLKRIEIIKLST